RKQDQESLIAFEGFGPRGPEGAAPQFVQPNQSWLQAISLPIVHWFSENHHAVHTTRIEFHLRGNDEYWFHVRHGDTCRWTRKIGDQKTEFVRFTVEDEETIVYSVPEDELWI